MATAAAASSLLEKPLRAYLIVYYNTGSERALNDACTLLYGFLGQHARDVLRIRRAEDRQETVQLSMVRVLDGLRRQLYSPWAASSPLAWAATVQRNQYLNQCKAKNPARPNTLALESAPAYERLPSPQTSLEARALGQHLLDAVDLLLWQLSAQRAEAIRLYYYHGLTLEQAAELLGVPLNTYKTRLFKGLGALRGLVARLPRPTQAMYEALVGVDTGARFGAGDSHRTRPNGYASRKIKKARAKAARLGCAA